MSGKLDFIDLKILESLGVYGPRNLTDVARRLGIPSETCRKRLKRISSHVFLRFHANVYHTNLGLKKAVVFAEAVPGCEELLFDCLKTNDFWIYVSRCYGMNEGCVGVYTIPKDHCVDFQEFLNQLKEYGVVRDAKIFWSTCFQCVHSKCNWFNEHSKTWFFPWDKWIEEISTQGTKLPYTLIDPQDFPVMGDEIDVFILKELEKNPVVSLRDLGNMLRISPQLVRYHYKKHILERGLLESFEVLTFHFDPAASDTLLFILEFDSKEKLARFALSLLDKSFVGTLGKVLGKNALIVRIYLPRNEFREFIEILSRLIRADLLERYSYVILDIRKTSRQTISYEYFKDGLWTYDHNKHVQKLRELVESNLSREHPCRSRITA